MTRTVSQRKNLTMDMKMCLVLMLLQTCCFVLHVLEAATCGMKRESASRELSLPVLCYAVTVAVMLLSLEHLFHTEIVFLLRTL